MGYFLLFGNSPPLFFLLAKAKIMQLDPTMLSIKLKNYTQLLKNLECFIRNDLQIKKLSCYNFIWQIVKKNKNVHFLAGRQHWAQAHRGFDVTCEGLRKVQSGLGLATQVDWDSSPRLAKDEVNPWVLQRWIVGERWKDEHPRRRSQKDKTQFAWEQG